MRVRRGVVGAVTVLAALTAALPATALTCLRVSLHGEVMAADAVFEATIAARRPVNPIVFRVLAWFGATLTNTTDRFELSLEDVEPLRGSSPAMIRTGYDYLAPGGRYVFIARTRWLGAPFVGSCGGQAIEASEASELKAWIALPTPAADGRLFGAVRP
jgi:hypothetical protein